MGNAPRRGDSRPSSPSSFLLLLKLASSIRLENLLPSTAKYSIPTFTPVRSSLSLLAIHLLLPLLTMVTLATAAESPDECCRRHAIPQRCVDTLCYPSRPPGDFDIYDIFERRGGPKQTASTTTTNHDDCSKYLQHVGECLAQGRDHSPCCLDEAKDRDESACFGLCRGEGHARHANTWQHYQTCLAINLPSMFQCFQKGYRDAPTPPRAVAVAQIRASEALVSWEAPAENVNLVDRYELALYSVEEGEADRDSKLLLETTDGQLSLSDLEPGSKYEVRIRALTANSNAKSLYASPAVQFQTPGTAPVVEPFKRVVSVAAKASSALLACRFQVSSGGLFRTQWLRNSVPIEGQGRFNSTSHYLYSAPRPRRHVMLLDISELLPAQDAGEYTCVVRDDYGEKSAKVELKVAETPSARPTPPLTPLECCQAKGVETRCLPMCGGAGQTENKRYVPRPIMPANCSGEISKVLSCAMPEVDDSECCLRGRVPQQCMYLCDSSLGAQNQMSPQCLEYLGAVEGCRTKGVQRRPSSIRNLRLTNPTSRTVSQTALVTWEESANAETYHVYWRNRRIGEPQWQWRSQSSSTSRRVMNADEIVVVAANAYGTSQSAKLRLSEDGLQWLRSSGVVD